MSSVEGMKELENVWQEKIKRVFCQKEKSRGRILRNRAAKKVLLIPSEL